MLHVILTILKIIGIIIVIILGLLLLMILSVLFVPLRYKVKAEKHEEITGIIKLSWLIHIVSAYIAYTNNELVYKIKIFGFTVINSLKVDSVDETDDIYEKNEEDSKKDKKKYRKRNKEKTLKIDNNYTHITDDYIYTINEDDNEDNDDDVDDVVVQAQSIGDTDKTKNFTPNKNKKISLISRLQSIYEKITSKIKSIFLKIRDTIINIYNKIINIKASISEKNSYFNENINTEENRILLKFLVSQLKIILKHIAPRKYKIYVKYGSGEPDVTGKVISYVAIANAFFNMNLNFVPVFDEQVLEGELYLRGRIRVFTMLIIAFRVYRNKQFKKMIKKFK